jgi:hypothetical protein
MYRQSKKPGVRKKKSKAIDTTKPILKGSITAKRMIAVRLNESHILKLDSIANKKKATKTKVIGDLIDLAYAGLNDPLPKALNKLYSQILKGIDQEKQKAD